MENRLPIIYLVDSARGIPPTEDGDFSGIRNILVEFFRNNAKMSSMGINANSAVNGQLFCGVWPTSPSWSDEA